MGVALFLIGLLATLAAGVLLVIALVRKKGWGIIRSLALGGVGIVVAIIGIVIGVTEEVQKPDNISPVTPKSIPGTTQETEIGESRLNPVPTGKSLTYGDERIAVISSRRAANIGWSSPDVGKTYLIVNVEIDFFGDPSEKRHYLSSINFRVVGSGGQIYDALFYPETDTPLVSGEFYGGATTSGDLVYEVDEKETGLVLIWNCGLGVDRYLEIP